LSIRKRWLGSVRFRNRPEFTLLRSGARTRTITLSRVNEPASTHLRFALGPFVFPTAYHVHAERARIANELTPRSSQRLVDTPRNVSTSQAGERPHPVGPWARKVRDDTSPHPQTARTASVAGKPFFADRPGDAPSGAMAPSTAATMPREGASERPIAIHEVTHRLLHRILRESITPVSCHPISLRRAASPAADDASQIVRSETAREAPRRPRASRERQGSLAAEAMIDVERLTDEVIRRIDAKILAHRERMGRAF
jgi:hypothetical protein